MKRIWLGLPVAVFALPTTADAQADGTPIVTLSSGFDASDPGLIRNARPLDGYREWLTPADFPPEAFEGRYGRGFDIELVVNADDTVASCVPRTPLPEFRPLAARACELVLERGRFRHALDAEGRARAGNASIFVTLARLLPGQTRVPPPAPPPPAYLNTRPVIQDANLLRVRADPSLYLSDPINALLDIDEKGRVTRCRILASSGTDAGDIAICRQLQAARFEPGHNPQGRPISTERHFVRLEVSP